MRTERRAFPHRGRESGQVIILVVIVLAVLGGGWWFLKSNRDMRDREARAFANEIVTRLVLQGDTRFLDRNLTQKAQLLYPPSWRMRFFDYIRQQGPPPATFQMTKEEVLFQSYFFEPSATFIAQFNYPNGPAYLEVNISHPGALWVIDSINWTWSPAAPTPTPPPPPAPVEVISPSPTPSASPKASRPRR
jgi:hypothetical protein